MPNASVTPRRHRISKIILLVILALGVLLFLKRNAVYDWWRLYSYTPPPMIISLAQADTMTAEATHLFYINRPLVQPKSNFSTYCPSGTEQSVVLGCYRSTQRGIYLLDVNNKDLAGIEQVTAAHEMLHAAYDRLGASERQNIDRQLQAYYDTQLNDADLKATIDSYRKTEPHDVVNEMHSIFGTEVADLPTGLSKYYTRYFNDRSKVTGYYATYNQAFTGRKQQIKDDDTRLNIQKTAIDDLTAAVKQQQSSLADQRQAIEALRASNSSDYNAKVDAYNSGINAYNANVRRLQTLITSYNQLVTERNAIAIEERQLVQAISATPISQ